MTTKFTRIIDGELPATFVWRDPLCVAFMSNRPLTPGHTLVVPVEPVDHWLDTSSEIRNHLTEVAARIGQAQQQAFNPQRIALLVAGFEVPHLHLHVIPADTIDNLNLSDAPPPVPEEQLSAPAAAITAALKRLPVLV